MLKINSTTKNKEKQNMKKTIAILLLSLFCVSAKADITVVVPGPSGWWRIVLPEVEKHLGEKIVPEIIQGARDIPAGNKWHEKFRFDNNAIWFSNGGQAEAYLLEDVKYNFKDYEPIFAQNSTITVGYNKDKDPYTNGVKFAAGSGMNPDAMAITMLVCGPQPSMQAYLDCFKKKVTYIKGMNNNETHLTYQRQETNVIRDNPFAMKQMYDSSPFNKTWFSAGLFDTKTGKIIPDPNYPEGTRSFPEAYKAKWGKLPEGEFYDAWVLVKNYRDVLQKVIWVNKGNPNKDRLIAAAQKMIKDPESQKIISEKVGTYPWWIAGEVTEAQVKLDSILTEKALKDLIWWTKEAYQIDAQYKPEIVSKIKK
jgi:hypothetical protein